jgi:hypothetical protein
MLAEAARLDPGRLARHATSRSPADSVGRWKTELAPPLRHACEETFGEALATFGYA